MGRGGPDLTAASTGGKFLRIKSARARSPSAAARPRLPRRRSRAAPRRRPPRRPRARPAPTRLPHARPAPARRALADGAARRRSPGRRTEAALATRIAGKF